MNKKMIASIIGILSVVIFISISGCDGIKTKSNERSSSDTTITSNLPDDTNTSLNVTSETIATFEGVYKYDYENDTEDLVEDHYIILEIDNGNLKGRYYGTSDDFDEAREGYYPGFFVSSMRDLEIKDNKITFSIHLHKNDMFSKPVNLKYKTNEEVPLNENTQWVNSHMVEVSEKNPRNYNGEIVDERIVLNTELGQRIFIKIKDM